MELVKPSINLRAGCIQGMLGKWLPIVLKSVMDSLQGKLSELLPHMRGTTSHPHGKEVHGALAYIPPTGHISIAPVAVEPPIAASSPPRKRRLRESTMAQNAKPPEPARSSKQATLAPVKAEAIQSPHGELFNATAYISPLASMDSPPPVTRAPEPSLAALVRLKPPSQSLREPHFMPGPRGRGRRGLAVGMRGRGRGRSSELPRRGAQPAGPGRGMRGRGRPPLVGTVPGRGSASGAGGRWGGRAGLPSRGPGRGLGRGPHPGGRFAAVQSVLQGVKLPVQRKAAISYISPIPTAATTSVPPVVVATEPQAATTVLAVPLSKVS